MKKLIFATLFVATTLTAGAQVRRDANGNYYTSVRVKSDTVNTGHTYTDSKGNNYPVFRSARSGRLVVPRFSQTGNYYRQYLKLD